MVFSIFLPVRSKQNWIESNYRSGWKWLHVPSSFSFPGNNFSYDYIFILSKMLTWWRKRCSIVKRPCFLHLLDRKDSKVGLQIGDLNLRSYLFYKFRTLFWLVRNATRWCNSGRLCHPVKINLKTVLRNYWSFWRGFQTWWVLESSGESFLVFKVTTW